MKETLDAGLVGLLAGSTLLVGAVVGWLVRVPRPVVSGVMAFGSGVLISALAFDLVTEAFELGGLTPTVTGFLIGSLAYVGADALLARHGARGRKSSTARPTPPGGSTGGAAIAIGALLDGIPESVVLGLSVAGGGAISFPLFAAIAISNIPEGLSSSAGMKASGRSAGYVFGIWGGITVISGVASAAGYALLADAPDGLIAAVTSVAAGAILAMIANTMIPEAFDRDRALTGLLTALGFLSAFALHFGV